MTDYSGWPAVHESLLPTLDHISYQDGERVHLETHHGTVVVPANQVTVVNQLLRPGDLVEFLPNPGQDRPSRLGRYRVWRVPNVWSADSEPLVSLHDSHEIEVSRVPLGQLVKVVEGIRRPLLAGGTVPDFASLKIDVTSEEPTRIAPHATRHLSFESMTRSGWRLTGWIEAAPATRFVADSDDPKPGSVHWQSTFTYHALLERVLWLGSDSIRKLHVASASSQDAQPVTPLNGSFTEQEVARADGGEVLPTQEALTPVIHSLLRGLLESVRAPRERIGG